MIRRRLTFAFALAAVSLGIHAHGGGGSQQAPEPPIVNPGPVGGPPSDAVVLFNGTSLANFKGQDGGEPRWTLADGAMASAGKGGVFSKEEFGDCQLHVEFATPSVPKGEGQGRGNSGVYLQGRLEIQVLDSYENKTYPNGQAGALYGNYAPLVNASRKPGEWQTYDIVYHAPKQLADGKVQPGSLTIFHNGVLIQDHVAVTTATTAGSPLSRFRREGSALPPRPRKPCPLPKRLGPPSVEAREKRALLLGRRRAPTRRAPIATAYGSQTTRKPAKGASASHQRLFGS